MTHDQTSRLYLTVDRAYKDLVRASYTTLGESVNDDIVVAKDALNRVLDDLKKIIEV